MSILSTAIPGVREIRGPLVAGYLWLLVAWLVVKPEPDLADATGLLGSVVDLAETVGPVATAAGISVLAYFVGAFQQGIVSLAQTIFSTVVGLGRVYAHEVRRSREAGDRAEPRSAGREPAPPPRESDPDTLVSAHAAAARRVLSMLMTILSRRSQIRRDRSRRLERYDSDRSRLRDVMRDIEATPAARRYAHRLVVRALPADFFPGIPETTRRLERVLPHLERERLEDVFQELWRLSDTFSSELDRPENLLLGADRELFGEADRLSAEAEFRVAVIPGLLGLIFVLAAEVATAYLALLFAPYVLGRQARVSRERARSLVREGIRLGRIPSPSLERVHEYVRNLEAAPERQAEQAEPAPVA